MNPVNFDLLKGLFNSADSDNSSRQLLKEILVLVLARATRADTNIENDELETVQSILANVLGETISVADIKLAATSEMFERRSLDRSLTKATRKLSDEDRILILQCLAQVFRADNHIRELELDYFDRVANALKATPSEIAGLRAGPI
ncbi:TerB family tellurite resistance protein [Gammaproteobacteria bacterium LSUCC0112]|nr:TerB family tellurite resistance protein [Gammaproteobacteria bacterium LSUCC0112]